MIRGLEPVPVSHSQTALKLKAISSLSRSLPISITYITEPFQALLFSAKGGVAVFYIYGYTAPRPFLSYTSAILCFLHFILSHIPVMPSEG